MNLVDKDSACGSTWSAITAARSDRVVEHLLVVGVT
jgi:hypothetical protein